MKKLFFPLLVCCLFACTQRKQTEKQDAMIVITTEKEVAIHVGKTVTLRGEVSNSKIAQILGVDVESFSPDLRGKLATATGVLKKTVVKEKDIDPYSAHRGAGTFYRLVDVTTGRLVQVQEP